MNSPADHIIDFGLRRMLGAPAKEDLAYRVLSRWHRGDRGCTPDFARSPARPESQRRLVRLAALGSIAAALLVAAWAFAMGAFDGIPHTSSDALRIHVARLNAQDLELVSVDSLDTGDTIVAWDAIRLPIRIAEGDLTFATEPETVIRLAANGPQLLLGGGTIETGPTRARIETPAGTVDLDANSRIGITARPFAPQPGSFASLARDIRASTFAGAVVVTSQLAAGNASFSPLPQGPTRALGRDREDTWLVSSGIVQPLRTGPGDGPIVAMGQLVQRSLTRIAFIDPTVHPMGRGVAGQLLIEHGTPPWRAHYDSILNDLAGRRVRLGSDSWTRLETTVPVRIAGATVAAGQHYLALGRGDPGPFLLYVMDAAAMRAMNLDASQSALDLPALAIPLSHERRPEQIGDLTIRLLPDENVIGKARLEIAWGPHRLTAEVTAVLDGK